MFLCPLTGVPTTLTQSSENMSFSYETTLTGLVWFTDLALQAASSLSEDQRRILAGICRNRDIADAKPEIINLEFLQRLYDLEIPYSFEARATHFLKYLYDHGGKNYQTHNFNSVKDSPITYSTAEEFENIVRYLRNENWIEYDEMLPTNSGVFYQSLSLKKGGLVEVEKGQPKIPMYDLVNQKITTGDAKTDAIIEDARKQFFSDISTMETKRSACEKLSYVIEPLRTHLETLFSGDTEKFFQIVNTFDIRHNKQSTIRIEHEEQLEWVFYSLLNTISTYVKMRRKLSAHE